MPTDEIPDITDTANEPVDDQVQYEASDAGSEYADMSEMQCD